MKDTNPSSPSPVSSKDYKEMIMVPADKISSTHLWDEWGVVSLIAAGVVGLVLFLQALVQLVSNIKEFLKNQEDEDDKRQEPFKNRLKLLEENQEKFHSKDHIDREFSRLDIKLDHEKSNRQLSDDRLCDEIKVLARNISEEQKARARMEAQIEASTQNTKRIEDTLEVIRERIDERFDKIQEFLTSKYTPN